MLDRAGRGGLLAAAFASHGACCPGSLPACRAPNVRQGPDGLLLGAWLAALAGPAWLERWLEDRIAVPPPSGGVLGADRAPVPMFEAAATPARVGAPARHLGWKRWLAALARALAEGTAMRSFAVQRCDGAARTPVPMFAAAAAAATRRSVARSGHLGWKPVGWQPWLERWLKVPLCGPSPSGGVLGPIGHPSRCSRRQQRPAGR